MSTKTCTQCNETKEIDEFHKGKNYKNGIRSQCKACEATRLKVWRKENPDKLKDQWRVGRERCKERQVGAYSQTQEFKDKKRDQYLRRTYGITLEDERQMKVEQNYKCAACGQEKPLVVDHCHKTGKVRLLLCDRCNRMIGHAEENPAYLRKLADFLEALADR